MLLSTFIKLQFATLTMQTSLKWNAVSGFAVSAARLTFSGTMQTLRAWQPAPGQGSETLSSALLSQTLHRLYGRRGWLYSADDLVVNFLRQKFTQNKSDSL
jgi:hypothetical protein